MISKPTDMPAYFEITEWDGTTAVVKAIRCVGGVIMKYADGICHEVSERYFLETLGADPYPVCWCGSNEPASVPYWGGWPCCPDCLIV